MGAGSGEPVGKGETGDSGLGESGFGWSDMWLWRKLRGWKGLSSNEEFWLEGKGLAGRAWGIDGSGCEFCWWDFFW